MVSVVQLFPSRPGQSGVAALDSLVEVLTAGLAAPERDLVARALDFAEPLYAGQVLSTGEPVWTHALGLAASLAAIGMDPVARAAGILFAAPKYLDDAGALERRFGAEIAALAGGVEKLYQLRVLTRASAGEQNEILRKMVLGMAEDIRVVLIRLASRTQTLRFFSKGSSEEKVGFARETLNIYSPLANRLGVWQLKWELEDLSFRIIEPELYKKIAQMLDEKRLEREQYIASSMAVLKVELGKAGLEGEVTGRPKHIYSIWNKMRAKQLDFSDVHDVRALRVIVPTPGECYSVLGIVHDLWEPIPKEFDDYISRPKGNNYQSLHTAVIGPGGRTLEVQIRTEQMHRQAEFGIAAHWRYKESRKTSKAESGFDDKIAWLRELLAWRDEVADGTGWAEKTKKASLDDTIYVVTPQGKVIDLPAGSTPVDFAYTLHTDLGHRCRGARVDGHIVPLDRALASGQRVEIIAAKTGGPSRDWLNPALGFLKSHRARGKVRQWFNAQSLAETVAQGRATVEKEQRREGATQASLERLAQKLGFGKTDELFAAVARDELNLRQLQGALRELGGGAAPAVDTGLQPRKARARAASDGGILVVGMDRLMTQLAKCCKPVPPDPVRGFVTRGKGISVHRDDCTSLKRLSERSPERLIDAQWGAQSAGAYPVDVLVTASDRQGLLRDIGEALARERINVTAVRTQNRDDIAHMRFSFEVADVAHLRRALATVKDVGGVIRVARGK
ncbi:MAG: bifunctional (p)ppGpp synthetase/guanosine-3',5'-bis(diphosphate) 3'-pyrophosphohydrolase [Candidatus Parcubacteria bacterium]|nr:bifunctional (p)ppGpp synthetase/guanosine-3',5'-bis(diphosphate) 3'-pyrophosphohydrolase [Burkholderiales bacterium]